MKINKSKLFLFAILVLCASCVKNDNNGPTVFDIHCIDSYGDPASGVAVTVFGNYTDWANNTNPLYAETTDGNGNVSFSGLYSQVYYFNCTDANNCLTNWDVYQSNGSIEPHVTNSINLVLTGYGTLKVTNTSSGGNPYKILVNGQVWINDLEYTDPPAREILPVGNYTVEAIQLNGPNDVPYYNVPIGQCKTTPLDIP